MINEQLQELIAQGYDETIHTIDYDENNNITGFRAKPAIEPRFISNVDFMDRLYQSELTQVYTLAKTEPVIEMFKDRLLQDSQINLNDASLKARLNELAPYITFEASKTDGLTRVEEIIL